MFCINFYKISHFLLMLYLFYIGIGMSKTVYNRIKSALADSGKSNKDLADKLNVAVETVSSWCTNSAQPSIKTLFLIAEFLNVEAGVLLVKRSDVKAIK